MRRALSVLALLCMIVVIFARPSVARVAASLPADDGIPPWFVAVPAGGSTPTPTPTPTATPTATPSPTPSPTPTPGASQIPAMAYYQGNNENTGLTSAAAFMAANYPWTEQAVNGSGQSAAAAYVAAGGQHAMGYTDPNALNCPNNTYGSCVGDDVQSIMDAMGSSGFATTSACTGTIAYSGGQQRTNPLDATAGTGFAATWASQISSLASGTPAWSNADGGTFEIDTMNWVGTDNFLTHGGPFCAPAPTTQAQVTTAQANNINLLSPQQVVGNGVDYDYPKAICTTPANLSCYDAWLNAVGSNLIGVFNECSITCSSDSGYITNNGSVYPSSAFDHQLQGILDVLNRGLYDMMWNEPSSNDTVHRLYALGTVFLVTDGTHVIYWMDSCATATVGGHCDSTWDDKAFVPTGPLASGGCTGTLTNPTCSTAALKTGNVYVREFSQCFFHSVSVGHCAAIVNADLTNSASIPTLTNTYTQVLTLASTSLYSGGLASLTAQAQPTTIGAHTGIILVQ